MANKADDRPDDDHIHDDDGDARDKRRRVSRACDVCRKKKIRCDGLQPEKGACSNCASYGHVCTFADAVKKRAPPRSYVTALEKRMEKAEEMIRQLAPYLDLDKAIGPMPVLPSDRKEGEEESPHLNSTLPSTDLQITSNSNTNSHHPSRQLSEHSTYEDTDDFEAEDDDEDAAYLQLSLADMQLEDQMPEKMIATVNKKAQVEGQELFRIDNNAMGFNDATKDKVVARTNSDTDAPMQFLGRASNFHILPLLERMSQNNKTTPPLQPDDTSDVLASILSGSSDDTSKDYSSVDFAWPEEDLQNTLINAYLGRHNRDMPILNEVVTRKMLNGPAKEWTDGGTILIALGVFSIASRYVDDSRLIMANGNFRGQHWHKMQKRLLADAFAKHFTAVIFIQATLMSISYAASEPKSTFVHAWVSLSVVVRMLEDYGAHRKFTAERLGWSLLTEETYKRLWWVTYVLDRQLSADLGRPMAIQDEDFDLDEILLVDDEYIYQASEKQVEAVQPAGKLCFYEGFLQTARLSQVIGRTLRTIYAISKSKVSRGFVGKKWDVLVVADIDKSLNKWLEGVPSFLRYNPNEPNLEVFLQSCRVFVQYYYTQTLIHRPFIQSEKMSKSDLTFESLAIVSNAARSAIHIMHNLKQRSFIINANPDTCFRSFEFGCMLLFISWSAYANNLRVSQSLMGDVQKVMDILHEMKKNFPVAKNMAMMMQIIINRSELPILNTGNRQSSKRGLEEEEGALQGKVSVGATGEGEENATSTTEAEPRDIRSIPSNLGGYINQLPLSTFELQSAFNSTGLDHQSSMGLGVWNQGQAQQQVPPQTLPQQQQQAPTSQPYLSTPSTSFAPTYSNAAIDSTIFDPTNRTLDNFLSGRFSGNSFDMFNATPTDSGVQSSSNAEALNVVNGMGNLDSQTPMSGPQSIDPLDALVNMQSLWSDADWMRALDQQT